MPDLYFYEHYSLGRWWPRTEPQQPATRTSDGHRPRIRGVIKVDQRHAHYSLKALREIYSVDGRFVATQDPEHVRRVREAVA